MEFLRDRSNAAARGPAAGHNDQAKRVIGGRNSGADFRAEMGAAGRSDNSTGSGTIFRAAIRGGAICICIIEHALAQAWAQQFFSPAIADPGCAQRVNTAGVAALRQGAFSAAAYTP